MTTSKVQSIIFDKSLWKLTDAKQWLKKHGYKYNKIDDKANYIRFRQLRPLKKYNYATIDLGVGIKFILAYT